MTQYAVGTNGQRIAVAGKRFQICFDAIDGAVHGLVLGTPVGMHSLQTRSVRMKAVTIRLHNNRYAEIESGFATREKTLKHRY